MSTLLPDVLGRIEENNPPVFWSLIQEVYPGIVEGMFEAALVTGVVQQSNVAVTLQTNTTYFSLQNNVAIGVPRGTIGVLRMRAPYPIKKTSQFALDNWQPGWQQAAPTDQIQAWFPLGLSAFGIYPQLQDQAIVTMDFIVSPVNKVTPYNGAEVMPFQTEYYDAFSQYAAGILRSKEGGAEAEEAAEVLQDYLGRLKALSAFQGRLDSLVYSKGYGTQTEVNPRKEV